MMQEPARLPPEVGCEQCAGHTELVFAETQPFLSDVIQLSAQRMALTGQTQQAVAAYAYVRVKG